MAKRLPNSQHYAPRRKGWGASIRAWCTPVFLWEHRRLGFDSPHGAINFKIRTTMATLSELCALPTEWAEREERKEHNKAIGVEKKMAWKLVKREEHDRMKAYRERELRRMQRTGVYELSLTASRRKVAQETMPEPMRKETRAEIFFAGKGVRSAKRVKNRASSEEMGTIGNRIVVKRFANSRTTCVCKSRIY